MSKKSKEPDIMDNKGLSIVMRNSVSNININKDIPPANKGLQKSTLNGWILKIK